MKFITPKTIPDTALTSHSVAETDHPAWSAATAYAVGARVIRTTSTTHRIYERLIAGTTATAPELDPVNWRDVGPTNRWAMFDSSVGTLTTATTSITATFSPGLVDSLALLDVAGNDVTVTVRDGVGGTVVYTRAVDLNQGAGVLDWFNYFFDDIVRATTVVLEDLPPYGTASVTVALTGVGTVAIGSCIVGRVTDMGGSRFGMSLGIVDYSRKDTDEFGVTTVVERPFSRRLTVPIEVPTGAIDEIVRRLAIVRAKPVVWIGSANYGASVIYGFARDWSIDLQYPTVSECTLTVEGLT